MRPSLLMAFVLSLALTACAKQAEPGNTVASNAVNSTDVRGSAMAPTVTMQTVTVTAEAPAEPVVEVAVGEIETVGAEAFDSAPSLASTNGAGVVRGEVGKAAGAVSNKSTRPSRATPTVLAPIVVKPTRS